MLYPMIEPYQKHYIQVDAVHTLYVEEAGHPKGLPVLITHGGPGFGCDTHYRCFFDPAVYRMVIFDQRGCGRSTPAPCLVNNLTEHTLSDIEFIREQLGIDRWAYFGGSWGSRLGLAYAQEYPARIVAMVLRGIYFADQNDINWFYGDQGAAQINLDYYRDLQKLVPGQTGLSLLKYYHKMLTGKDDALRRKAAQAYTLWTVRNCTLMLNPDLIQLWANDMHTSLCFSLISTHYLLSDPYLKQNHPLDKIDAIAHIPAAIIHGRYDMICRAQNAWQLHDKWQKSRLALCNCGHASSEKHIQQALLDAAQTLKQYF